MKDKRHVIISGPSGCGKSTVIKKLLSVNTEFKFSISHTSRPKRETETDGKDYYFVTKDKFKKMIDNKEFLEYAVYNDHYYGTSVNQLKNQNELIVMDLEKQGVENLKNIQNSFRCIFIYCTKEELLKRLVKRHTINIERLYDISKRLSEVDADFEVYKKGIYDLGVENVDINQTFKIIYDFLCNGKT